MEKMNFGTFKKEVLKKGQIQEVQVDSYFTLERHSAKTVYLSKHVEEPFMVTYNRRMIAMVLPDKGNVMESLQPYFTELQHFIRVLAPVISVFDKKGIKIGQLNEEKKAGIA